MRRHTKNKARYEYRFKIVTGNAHVRFKESRNDWGDIYECLICDTEADFTHDMQYVSQKNYGRSPRAMTKEH